MHKSMVAFQHMRANSSHRQPHWTLVCVPADNTDESSGKIGASPSSQDILGPAAADVDLSQAHLELCLDLELPLVIVITKYDLATKAGLRQTLSNLLSVLKEAGRKPCIISRSEERRVGKECRCRWST